MPSSSLTRFLPPIARQLARRRAAREKLAKKKQDRKPTATGRDRRKRPRITIDQLNKLSEKELRELGEKAKEKKDVRPTYVKALDWLDVPRNAVFNVIGGLAGVDKKKVRKGTFLPKVYASDVLEKLGWKGKSTGNRVGRGAVGFLADVALDPLTYLSAGATTGAKLIKHAPKILKTGQKAVRGAANVMARGGVVSGSVAKAIGKTPEQLARLGTLMTKKYGLKQAVKRLSKGRGKGGAWMWRRMQKAVTGGAGKKGVAGSSAFIAKHGEKGRTLLRVPFMSKGVTLPGKRRKLWQAFQKGATGLPEVGASGRVVSKAAGATGKAGGELAETTAAETAKLKEASTAVAGTREAAKEAIAGLNRPGQISISKTARKRLQGMLTRGARQTKADVKKAAQEAIEAGKQGLEKAQGAEGAARAKYVGLLSAKDAPQPVKELGRRTFGTAAKGGVSRWLREKFGGPESRLKQQLQAKTMQQSMGAAAAGGHGGLEIRTALKPVAESLAAKTGMAADDVVNHLFDALEVTGKEGAGAFDVGLQRFLKSPVGQSDEARAFVETFRQAQGGPWDKLKATHARLGLAAPEESALGHVAGVMDKGAQKAIDAQRAVTRKTPFNPARMKVRQMTRQQSMQPLQSEVVKSGAATEQKLIQQGYQKGRTGFATSAERDAMTQKGNLAGLVGEDYRGPLYGRDIPLSAAKGIAETEKRTALLEGVEQIMPYSMPITPQEVGGLQARGLGMVDQNLFANHPLNGTGIEKLLAGKAFPQPVKELFDNFLRSTANPKEIDKVLKVSDWLFGKWKSFALFHPAYTLRNMFQNLFGATMARANPFKVAKRSISSDVRKIFNAIESGADLGDDVFQFAGGSRPMREVMLALKGTNMANAGLTADIMYDSLTGSQRVGKMMGGPTGAWFRMNNRVETQMRIGLWATFVDEGYSYGEAAQRVLKAMPDLSDLTVWERNVGKRLFPWYSWMRKNGGLQASYLMNQPGWMAGSEKLRHSMEEAFVGADKVDEELRPKWMQEQQAFQVAGDKNEGHMWLLASWLPFQDLVKIASGTMSLQEGARAGLEQMRPEIKFVAEQATGHDIFRRQELADQSTPQAIKNVFPALLGRSGTPLDNLLAIRPIKEYGKRVWEMPTTGAGIARATLGGAIQPASRARGLQSENIAIREQMMRVRGQINRARESGDQAALKNLMRLWIQLNARARRLGLPSVAKRTQETLSKFGLPQGEPAFAEGS